MRENFGNEKPIPAETVRRRKLPVQEAARLYIHHFWDITRCANTVGVAAETLRRACNEDGWDQFAAMISETLKPSIWTAACIEVPDVGLIAREKKRRVDGINDLLCEEKRIMEAIPFMEVGSKAYSGALAALNGLRKLIDNATGQEYYSQEQSAARKALMAREIKRDMKGGDDAKPATGITLDI